MENTTINKDTLLKQLNDEKASLMAPVIVLLVIYMIMGLFGNGMACYFYACKARQSTNTVFIVAMTMYDLIVCGLSIPIEIVDLRFFYLFTNGGACKFLRFVNYFGVLGSAFVLLVIAVDRYRKICKPFKKQLKLKEAKIACGISVLVSLALSWPVFVFYSSVAVDVPTDDGEALKGHDCTTQRGDEYKIYLWIFNGVHLLLFVISSILLSVVYTLIGRVLIKHNKSRKYSVLPGTGNSNSEITETHLTELNLSKYTDNQPKKSETNVTTIYTVSDVVSCSRQQSSIRRKPQNPLNIKNVKYTTMMLVVTILYILCFLPYLTISLWRAFISKYEVNVLTDGELVAVQIGIRSYFLNSAINPFAYGLFNPKFRTFFSQIFCLCCRKQSESSTTPTSSVATTENNA